MKQKEVTISSPLFYFIKLRLKTVLQGHLHQKELAVFSVVT